MSQVLHNRSTLIEVAKMRSSLVFVALLALGMQAEVAGAQGYGQGGPMGGQIGGQGQMGPRGAPPQETIPSNPSPEKPDKAAAKAYAAGTKALNKARELQDLIATSTDPEKKAKAEEKLQDTYGAALDQFTEVLRNKPDMYDAWNEVGYVHLKLGAYRESIDDYDHALKLKPDLPEAVAHRALAFVMTDRLDEAKAAYMDLFFHERPLADELMVHMQDWVQRHRAASNGVRPADIDSFDKWVTERSGIAKTAAAGGN
jgi:tetratricopeptide (TPR) repeat protein